MQKFKSKSSIKIAGKLGDCDLTYVIYMCLDSKIYIKRTNNAFEYFSFFLLAVLFNAHQYIFNP